MPRSTTTCRIVYVTVPTKKSARTLASLAIKNRLAACVNILGPIRSVYEWKGALRTTKEYALSCKTTAKQAPKLQKLLADAHEYECPCIVTIDIVGGHSPYLSWIKESVV